LKGKRYAKRGSNGFCFGSKKPFLGMLFFTSTSRLYFGDLKYQISSEGLNAYGAVTWGNFIYQGFNKNCGWMHTSSNVDVADMYAEK
jgi:acyl-homoserine lactone acylase PvdQ